MKRRLAALAAGLCLLLSGCDGLTVLPYARELEGMALMRTLGVDAEGEEVAVTAATGGQDPGQGENSAVVAARTAETISGAVLGMQAGGASYVYFGHVGQLLLGEDLARQSVAEALEYVLRDVEMRLDTELYLVQGGTAGGAIRQSAEGQPVADRLEAMEDDPGLASWSMARTVREVLADLERCGASFVPVLRMGEDLEAAGYGILRGEVLAGWAGEEAARGINLLLGKVDADIVEVASSGGTAALRVVGAKTTVRPVFEGEILTGLEICCRIDANLAEGGADLRDPAARSALEEALAQVEERRIREALALCRDLDADFMDLKSAAGLARPWRWGEICRQWELGGLDLSVTVKAGIQRSYDAVRQHDFNNW